MPAYGNDSKDGSSSTALPRTIREDLTDLEKRKAESCVQQIMDMIPDELAGSTKHKDP